MPSQHCVDHTQPPAALDYQNKVRWLLHKANNPKHMLQRVLRSPKTKAEFKHLTQAQRNPYKYHCNRVPR